MNLRAYLLPLCLFLASPVVYASVIDLTHANTPTQTATASAGGVFLVSQTSHQSTGTGLIDSFLRIQQNGHEEGYNTNETNPPFDAKNGNFTHALLLSEVPIVTINGVEYREFLLDINQNEENLLSLNQIQIFQSSGDAAYTGITEAVSGTTDAVITFGGGVNQVFQMNAANLSETARIEIQLNFTLNSGSGSGDMFLYIPNSDFNTALSNVILFSQFGNPRGTYSSNDGVEEWAVMTPTTITEVPEPASIVLLGTLLCAFGTLLKRRTA